MKRIGLLGGTAWPSTIEYYRIINEMAQFHYGSSHSAKILLWSIDYHEIRQSYPDDWRSIDLVLKRELLDFSETKPSCILICNNTLHESYDSIKNSLNLSIPVIHMVDLTIAKAKESNIEHVLLLGTKYTMEKGYYSSKFESLGIKVSIPCIDERIEIQEIQRHLASGEASSPYKEKISQILSNYIHCDAVVAACTELPLVVTEETTTLKILDPMRIQCEEGFKYAAI
jgi:aspartate racemase